MNDAAPRPRIEFSSERLAPEHRRRVAGIAAELVRAAAGHDEFAELWMADALTTALADAGTTVLVLSELSDLVCTLAGLVANGSGQDRDVVISRVAASWVDVGNDDPRFTP